MERSTGCYRFLARDLLLYHDRPASSSLSSTTRVRLLATTTATTKRKRRCTPRWNPTKKTRRDKTAVRKPEDKLSGGHDDIDSDSHYGDDSESKTFPQRGQNSQEGHNRTDQSRATINPLPPAGEQASSSPSVEHARGHDSRSSFFGKLGFVPFLFPAFISFGQGTDYGRPPWGRN